MSRRCTILIAMEKPTLQSEEAQVETTNGFESKEAVQERIDVLKDVVEEFQKNVRPAITDWENKTRVEFQKEGGYDNEQKNGALANLLTRLVTFDTHVQAMYQLFEVSGGGEGLNYILGQIRNVKERLQAAPDVRYSKDAQVETFGGDKKNIPGEKVLDTYEETVKVIDALKHEIAGIASALAFMTPKKK